METITVAKLKKLKAINLVSLPIKILTIESVIWAKLSEMWPGLSLNNGITISMYPAKLHAILYSVSLQEHALAIKKYFTVCKYLCGS